MRDRTGGQGRLARIAGLAAAIAAALAALPAVAAGGDMKYVTSDLRKLPAGETTAATAKCPADTFVVGGGLSINGSNTATGMHSSYPVQLGKHRGGWRVVVNSRSAANKRFGAMATCAKKGRYTYLQGPKEEVANGAQDASAIGCDNVGPLVGGGVKLSGSNTFFSVSESRPQDSALDVDTVPDDTWRAVASNSSGRPQTVRAFAICDRSMAADFYVYEDELDTVPDVNQGTLAAGCQTGTEVTAGGATTSSASLNVELADSHSYDNGGGNEAPDDGWFVGVNNESGGPVTMYAYSICRA